MAATRSVRPIPPSLRMSPALPRRKAVRAPELELEGDISHHRRLCRIRAECFPLVRLIYGAADLCRRLCADDSSGARRGWHGGAHSRNNRSNRLRLRMRRTTQFAGTVLMSDTRQFLLQNKPHRDCGRPIRHPRRFCRRHSPSPRRMKMKVIPSPAHNRRRRRVVPSPNPV